MDLMRTRTIGCDGRVQVTGLADEFSGVRDELVAAPRRASAKNASASSGSKQSAHTLEGHRQTMAGVVPRLYQLLSNAVEGHSEGERRGGDDAAAKHRATIEGIQGVLHGKPWLWVGDAFVPADQAREDGDRWWIPVPSCARLSSVLSLRASSTPRSL